MSKITNDGKPGLAQDALQLYPYGNSGRQRVKILFSLTSMRTHSDFRASEIVRHCRTTGIYNHALFYFTGRQTVG